MKRFLNQIEGTDLAKIMDVCTVARRFSVGLLEKVLKIGEEHKEDLRRNLNVLRKYSFVRVLNDGSLSLHDIVREFMLDELRARSPHDYKELNQRLIDYYKEQLQGEISIEVRKSYLTELLYHSLHYNEDAGIELFRQTVSELDMYTQFDLRDALLNEIALFKFAKEENTHWQEYCKGYRAVNQGKWSIAEQHLTKIKDAARVPELLRCLSYDTLGELYVGQGRYSFAIDILEKSLDLKEYLPASVGLSSVGQTLSKLTECYAIIGKYKRAEGYADRILHSIQEYENQTAKGWALKSLGDTYRLWGKTRQSIDNFENALSIFDHIGDAYAVAHVRTQLGRVYLHDGQWARAARNLTNASKAYENLWVEYGRANTILFMGNVHRFKKEWHKAKELYDQAYDAHQAMDAKREIGPLLGSMGVVHQYLGDRERALNCFQRSLQMKEAQEYIRGVSVTQIYLGDFYTSENRLETALGHFTLAQEKADQSRSNYHRVQSRSRIAACYLSLGQLANAENFALKAHNLAYRHGYKHEQSRVELVLYKIKSLQGADIFAGRHITRAIKHAVEYNCYLLSEILDEFISFVNSASFAPHTRQHFEAIVDYWTVNNLQELEEQNMKTEGISEKYTPLLERLSS